MKTLDLISNICDAMALHGFCSYPRVVDQEGFDLSEFKRQESDIEGFEIEYVKQIGPGICDDFHGSIAYPIEDKFFVIDFAS